MDEHQLITVLDRLTREHLTAWVAGGWAVDAVVGRQTRQHDDLDLAVNTDELGEVVSTLTELGYSPTVDWLPSRMELTAHDGSRVDLHPVRFAPDGSGWQAGTGTSGFDYTTDAFGQGVIADRVVPCLSLRQQLRFREGYELRDVDRHDLDLLRSQSVE